MKKAFIFFSVLALSTFHVLPQGVVQSGWTTTKDPATARAALGITGGTSTPGFVAQTNTLVVSMSGNDSTGVRGTNAFLTPFSSLPGAKQVAQSGDVIFVTSGIYQPFSKPMGLCSNLTIVGDGSFPTIQYNGLGTNSLGLETNFMITAGSNLHIDGINVIDTNTSAQLAALIGMATNTPYATNVIVENGFWSGDGDTFYFVSTNGGRGIVFNNIRADSWVDIYTEDVTNNTFVTLKNCRFFTTKSSFVGRRALKIGYGNTVAENSFFGLTNNSGGGSAVFMGHLSGLCDINLKNCTLSAPANALDVSLPSGTLPSQSPYVFDNVVEENKQPLTFTPETILKVVPLCVTALRVLPVDSDNFNFLFGLDLNSGVDILGTTNGMDGFILTNTGSLYPMSMIADGFDGVFVFNNSISAPSFNGAHNGNGAGLTNVAAVSLTNNTISLNLSYISTVDVTSGIDTNTVSHVASTNSLSSGFYTMANQNQSDGSLLEFIDYDFAKGNLPKTVLTNLALADTAVFGEIPGFFQTNAPTPLLNQDSAYFGINIAKKMTNGFGNVAMGYGLFRTQDTNILGSVGIGNSAGQSDKATVNCVYVGGFSGGGAGFKTNDVAIGEHAFASGTGNSNICIAADVVTPGGNSQLNIGNLITGTGVQMNGNTPANGAVQINGTLSVSGQITNTALWFVTNNVLATTTYTTGNGQTFTNGFGGRAELSIVGSISLSTGALSSLVIFSNLTSGIGDTFNPSAGTGQANSLPIYDSLPINSGDIVIITNIGSANFTLSRARIKF